MLREVELMGEVTRSPGFSRRTFLKWSGAVGGSTALVSTVTQLGMPARAEDNVEAASQIVWSACTVNCGSRCPLRLEVKGWHGHPSAAGRHRLGVRVGGVRRRVRGQVVHASALPHCSGPDNVGKAALTCGARRWPVPSGSGRHPKSHPCPHGVASNR